MEEYYDEPVYERGEILDMAIEDFIRSTNVTGNVRHPIMNLDDLEWIMNTFELEEILSRDINCGVDPYDGSAAFNGWRTWFVFSRGRQLRIPHASLEQFFYMYGSEIMFRRNDVNIDLVFFEADEGEGYDDFVLTWECTEFYYIMTRIYGHSFLKAFTPETKKTMKKTQKFPYVDAILFFCYVVLYSDGFFRLSHHKKVRYSRPSRNEKNLKRFIRIAAKLPSELQHVLCNRIFGFTEVFLDQKKVNRCFDLITRHCIKN